MLSLSPSSLFLQFSSQRPVTYPSPYLAKHSLDSIHFSGRLTKEAREAEVQSIQERLRAYAETLLKTVNKGQPLREGQKLKITAPSSYLPLIMPLVELAYSDFHSGKVLVRKQEPELDKIREQYGLLKATDYTKALDKEYKIAGAAELILDTKQANYAASGLTPDEIKRLKARVQPKLPKQTKDALAIDPNELLTKCLNLNPSQPLRILGHREHFPQIVSLVKEAAKLGTKLVDVQISENKEWDPAIPFYQ